MYSRSMSHLLSKIGQVLEGMEGMRAFIRQMDHSMHRGVLVADTVGRGESAAEGANKPDPEGGIGISTVGGVGGQGGCSGAHDGFWMELRERTFLSSTRSSVLCCRGGLDEQEHWLLKCPAMQQQREVPWGITDGQFGDLVRKLSGREHHLLGEIPVV
eukprot:gene18154-biopygen15959